MVPKGSSLSEVFEVSRMLTFASYKNVTISVWRETPTAVALQRVDPHVGRVVSKYPRVASVIVMEAVDFKSPDQQARAEHGRLTEKYEHATIGVAMIVDGSTAKHSLYRFILTTMTLLSAPTVVQKIFPSAGAAAGWLAVCDPSVDKNLLVQAIKDARLLPW
jgi:hypothetical protein